MLKFWVEYLIGEGSNIYFLIELHKYLFCIGLQICGVFPLPFKQGTVFLCSVSCSSAFDSNSFDDSDGSSKFSIQVMVFTVRFDWLFI